MFGYKVTLFFSIFCREFSLIYGHGRLMEPPSRASMWRVGYNSPVDENDNQGYCGGFGVQFNRNNGKCGICGDPWDVFPRPHEAPDGIYANGIITKTYTQGSLIPIIVDLSANHRGHFIFKICPNNNIFEDPSQSCLDKYPLKTGPATLRYKVKEGLYGLILLYVRLPSRLSCTQCILQWTYVGGNNWGVCSNGTSGMGCGDQEHFRSCADIRIIPSKLAIILNEYLEERDQMDEVYHDKDYFEDEEDQETLEALNSIGNDDHKRKMRQKLLGMLLDRMKELIATNETQEDNESEIDAPQMAIYPPSPTHIEEKRLTNRH
ncbi:uncharacterized protein [Lepeophtheirus salmonis]|uniref:uncharacterized protein isoform X1 n=1 Tax=Lepeophtheirus salmonis TaxID=72036 RepID=UPI001AE5F96A|nr:uncharacterized protein LOC121118921 isoform X1 [Lepeophtheirus salmonis]